MSAMGRGEVERKIKPVRHPDVEYEWFCPDCHSKAQIRYIATGHDHTDESYWVCTCKKDI